jgi:hypothetical protein
LTTGEETRSISRYCAIKREKDQKIYQMTLHVKLILYKSVD